jgi:hypothetical protein
MPGTGVPADTCPHSGRSPLVRRGGIVTGWLRRRIDTAIDRQAERILDAIADGHAHYVAGDLDKATGIHAGSMYPALARLEAQGQVESGWADLGPHRPRRRWYRLAEPLNKSTEGAAP